VEVDSVFFKILEKDESRRLSSYPDSNGVPTIGIGHKLTRSERHSGKIIIGGVPVKYTGGLTNAQVELLCRQDTKWAADCVNSHVTVSLTQTQFNVLVGFTFNVGTEAFQNSTLLRKLNSGLYREVPKELHRWVFDDGVFNQGLANRRWRDADLWSSTLQG